MTTDDVGTDAPADGADGERRQLDAPTRPLWSRAAPAVVPAVVAVVVALLVQESGHGWGDDFALYVHQAQALVKGDVGRVIADTRFMLDSSPTHTFSPPAYPWGLPLMLAPVVALLGLHWFALKAVIVACLAGLVVMIQRVTAPRLGTIVSSALALFVALCPLYWRWAGTVTSDIPSALFFFTTLWWIDRCRRHQLLVAASRRHLVILGLLLAWTFNFRRETIALALGLAALHATELWRLTRSTGTRGRSFAVIRDTSTWSAVALPYGVAVAAAVTFQLALPATLFPDRPPGGGIGKFGENLRWYRSVVAEALGLKDMGAEGVAAFGSRAAADWILLVFAVLVVVGIISALVLHGSRDLHIVATLLTTAYGVGTQPFHEFRYLLTIIPLMGYFALQTVSWIGNSDPSPSDTAPRTTSAATAIALVVALAPSAANLPDTVSSINYHLEYDYVLDGPASASSQEMFHAVERCTRGDEVISFAQARSMNLYTRRRAIQGSSTEWVLHRADWIVVSNDDVNYIEPPIDQELAAELGLVRVWHNDEYSLYEIPHGAIDPRRPCTEEP